MASDGKSPRKKRGKERNWEDKTSPQAVRKAERQVDRQEDEQTERQTETGFVGLLISSDSKSGVDPPLFRLPDAPGHYPLGRLDRTLHLH